MGKTKAKIMSAVLICTTVLFGLGIQMPNMSGRVTGASPQPLNGVNYLISAAGAHNAQVATELMQIAENVSRTPVGSTHYIATAADIRDYTGESMSPTFRLFQPIETDTTHVENFTSWNWRLVNITFPSGTGNPVFTFLMVGAYRTSIFASSENINDAYIDSQIRANINQDMENVLEYFNNAESYIVTPGNIPGDWQNVQPDGGNSRLSGLTGDAFNDLLWLPSSHEIELPTGAVHGQNIWQLTAEERLIDRLPGMGNQWAWLRSRAIATQANARIQHRDPLAVDGPVDAFSNTPATDIQLVRPAIHIDVAAIYNNVSVFSNFTNDSSINATVSTGQRTILTRNSAVTQEIIFNAGNGDTIQTITATLGTETKVIIPGITFDDAISLQNWTTADNDIVTLRTWYADPNARQHVHIEVNNLSTHLFLEIETTNQWYVSRDLNWPTGFGFIPPANPFDVLVSNSYTDALGIPVAAQIPLGHRFGGWWTSLTGGSQVTNTTAFQSVGNYDAPRITQIYAQWLENTATITRNLNFASAPTIATVTENVVFGSAAMDISGISGWYPIGQNFAGWWTQDGTNNVWGEQVTAQTIIATHGQNITIHARWETSNTVFVILMLNHPGGAGGPILTSAWIAQGDAYSVIPLTDPEFYGFEFIGWWTATTGGTKITSVCLVDYTFNHNLYARWREVGNVEVPTINQIDTVSGYIYWNNVPGVEGFVITINGNEIRIYGETNWNFTNLEPGTHTITIRAFDNAGVYSAQSMPLTIVIPTPSLPIFNAVFMSNGTIHKTLTDVDMANLEIQSLQDTATHRFTGWGLPTTTLGLNGETILTFTAQWEEIEQQGFFAANWPFIAMGVLALALVGLATLTIVRRKD
ncbi:MAG: InlB B-repeat-containing protein [Firmicutes bacterium]|nr:InlB B-repeat-containing protein [Bacillota bacterium]